MQTLYFTPVVSSFLFSPILVCHRLDVYHTSTHDVALAQIYNAGMKCAARSSLKIQDEKITQNSPSAHCQTTLSGYIFAIIACIDNPKKNLSNSNISSTCCHNVVNFGALMAVIDWRVCGTQEISTGFASWLCYCTEVAQQRSTKLCTVFCCLLIWYTLYTFLGALAP